MDALESFHRAMTQSYRAVLIDSQLVLPERHRHSVIETMTSLLVNEVPTGLVSDERTQKVNELIGNFRAARHVTEALGVDADRILEWLYVVTPGAVLRGSDMSVISRADEVSGDPLARFIQGLNTQRSAPVLLPQQVARIMTSPDFGDFVLGLAPSAPFVSDTSVSRVINLYSWEGCEWLLENVIFAQRPSPRILLITGVSGVGKTRLSQRLLDRHGAEFVQLRRTTTRPARHDELSFGDHQHVSTEEFERGIRAGEIKFVRKNYGFLYGFTREDIESASSVGRTWIIQAGGAVAQMRRVWPAAGVTTVAVVPVVTGPRLTKEDQEAIEAVLRPRILDREPILDDVTLERRLRTAFEDIPRMQVESDLILENPEDADLGKVFERLEAFATEPSDIEVEVRGWDVWVNCLQESGAICRVVVRQSLEAREEAQDTSFIRGRAIGQLIDCIELALRRTPLERVKRITIYQERASESRLGPISDVEARQGLIERYGWKYGMGRLSRVSIRVAAARRGSRQVPEVQLLRDIERAIERDVAGADRPTGRLAAARITQEYRRALQYAVLGFGDRDLLEHVGLYIYGSLAIGWAVVGSDVDYRLFCPPGTARARVTTFEKYFRRALSAVGLHPDCPEFTAAIEAGDWPRNLLDLSRYDSLRPVAGISVELRPRPRKPAVELAFHLLRIRPFQESGKLRVLDPKRNPGGIQDIERLLWMTLAEGYAPPEAIELIEGQSELRDALDYLLAIRLVLTLREQSLQMNLEGTLLLDEVGRTVTWMGRASDVLAKYDQHRGAVMELLRQRVRRLVSELPEEERLLFEALYDVDRLQLRRVDLPETAVHRSEAASILLAGAVTNRGTISRLYQNAPSWATLYALARNANTPAEILHDMVRRLRSQADRDVRLMVARNPGTGLETLDILQRDPEDIVAQAAEPEVSAWSEMRGPD
jgi:guanylate kinase